MNKKRRLWIWVALGITVILIIISVIAYVLYDFMVLEFGHPPPWPSGAQLTETFIMAQNHAVETLISQTQTATAQAPRGTLTPTPTS